MECERCKELEELLATVRLCFYAGSPEANAIDAALAKNPNPSGHPAAEASSASSEASGPVGLGLCLHDFAPGLHSESGDRVNRICRKCGAREFHEGRIAP